ncbi:hypothetical protein [Thiolapillus sp.]
MYSLFMMLVAVMPLGLWGVFHARADCRAGWVLLAAVSVFMALNMLESALMRRRALAGMYLRPDGLLARLLCRKTVLVIWQLLKAVALGLLLFMETPGWPSWLWAVLILNLVLLQPAYLGMRRWLSAQVQAGRRNIIARRLLLSLNTGILLLVLAAAQMFLPRADYSRMSWEETSRHAIRTVEVRCEHLAPLARLSALRDALTEWLIQHIPLHEGMRLGAWLVYFLWSGLVFWAWSRLVLGGLGARESLDFLVEDACA